MGWVVFSSCILFLLSIDSLVGANEFPAYGVSSIASAPYAPWAHSHWVWLASGDANRSSEMEFVQGFLERDIPVGAVDLDSQWATGDNDFVFDTSKYPDPADMIAQYHKLGIRVILWATSVVDTDSPNFAEGKSKGYFLTGAISDTVKWWHGVGSFIDYTNPDAVAWWHAQMDNVLNIGVDGFKCDGTDPFIYEMGVAFGKSGIVEYREYADAYYRDFFYYSRSKNPDALIMSRPVDSYDVLYWSFSPRDVVFSGWVGDQDPTFSGLQDALRNILHSGWANYVNFGSDIGGYRHGSGPLGRTKELFLRWAQMGAFVPLMENGGDQQHRPWMFDNTNETVDIYRTYVHAHMELGPYLLATGSAAYENGNSAISPIAEWTDLEPSTFAYKLGPDIFVSPITENGTTSQSVTFPTGDNWIDYWNTSLVYTGGSTVEYPLTLETYPVFHREGSLLPLNVTRSYVGHGDERSSAALTMLLMHPTVAGAKAVVREYGPDALSQECSYSMAPSMRFLNLHCTAHSRKLILQIHGVKQSPVAVSSARKRASLDGDLQHIAETHHDSLNSFYDGYQGYYYDIISSVLWVYSSDNMTGWDLVIEF